MAQTNYPTSGSHNVRAGQAGRGWPGLDSEEHTSLLQDNHSYRWLSMNIFVYWVQDLQYKNDIRNTQPTSRREWGLKHG
ncbi:hypothetical protein J4Q44_G00032450 [Coregonus suidteri]|uniref:Uncharacterized protein n=1 Tax=Coregonus suidteri TaxID=861788 RepID=A0AAN8MA52_9TELE